MAAKSLQEQLWGGVSLKEEGLKNSKAETLTHKQKFKKKGKIVTHQIMMSVLGNAETQRTIK